MPRTARDKSATGIYHVVLRGINRQTIFEDDEDAEKFLETLEAYKDISEYKIYGYCLMGNHIHLLIKEEKEDLGVIMKRIGASYVYWYNLKYSRIGHLFQDRYKSEAVDTDKYLLTVLRYIHQNPLKANLAKKIKAYRWSSYFEYISNQRLVDIDFILYMFNRDRKTAMSMFEMFHKEESNNRCLDIEDRVRINDREAIEIIKKLCYVSHCIDLQKLEKDLRDQYLKTLKEKGLSTRQIARLTGISRGVILKV